MCDRLEVVDCDRKGTPRGGLEPENIAQGSHRFVVSLGNFRSG
jgi:hypothetical protein